MGKQYFSHDIDSRSDKKIINLMFKHEWAGYGLYWAVVEFLHANDNCLSKDDLPCLAKNLNAEIEFLEQIIFNFDLFFVEKNKIYSKRVAKNLKQQKEISKKRKQAANKKWQSFREDANAEQMQSKCNAIKVNKIKEKEIKRKENNISYLEKKADPFINPSKDFFLNESEKVFNKRPRLNPAECNRIIEIASDNSDFKEVLPIALNKLANIKWEFKDGIKKPNVNWLLKDNNFERILNGEFDNQDSDEDLFKDIRAKEQAERERRNNANKE